MNNRKIFLWGLSRSVSTAMLKSFQQRPDVETQLAPFNDTYYYSTDRVTDMYGDAPNRAHKTFAWTCNDIMSRNGKTFFMKEMAYSVSKYDYTDFLAAATNTFIFRDPRLTLASRKKKRKDEIGEHEFGFSALKVLWDHEREKNPNAIPVLVDGEKLRADPERVLQTYCERISLPFCNSMLSWSEGPVKAFTEREALAQARWHEQVNSSTGFIKGSSIGTTLDTSILTDDEKQMLKTAEAIYEELSAHSI